MNAIRKTVRSKTAKFVAMACLGMGALFAMQGAASASDRGGRFHDARGASSHSHRSTDVRIDINLGRPAPRYEERVTKVWVEPVYRTVSERVWIEPVYQTVCDRVWVPDRYEMREVVHYVGRRKVVRCERVLVERGHWTTVERRVLVSAGCWRIVERQECVAPGHWEYRTEHVRMDRGSHNLFDIFVRR